MAFKELFQNDIRSGDAYSIGSVGTRIYRSIKRIRVDTMQHEVGVKIQINDTDKYGRPSIPQITLSHVAALFLGRELLSHVPLSMLREDKQFIELVSNVFPSEALEKLVSENQKS